MECRQEEEETDQHHRQLQIRKEGKRSNMDDRHLFLSGSFRVAPRPVGWFDTMAAEAAALKKNKIRQ